MSRLFSLPSAITIDEDDFKKEVVELLSNQADLLMTMDPDDSRCEMRGVFDCLRDDDCAYLGPKHGCSDKRAGPVSVFAIMHAVYHPMFKGTARPSEEE